MNRDGRAHHLARGQAAVDIPADPLKHRDAGPVAIERRHVEAELGGVPAQVTVFECFPPAEQQLVHVPEPALQRSGLGRGGRGVGVRVVPVSGKCRNANRMFPPRWRSTCSMAWNACRE